MSGPIRTTAIAISARSGAGFDDVLTAIDKLLPLAEQVLIRAFAGHESRIRGGDDVETRLDPHAVTLSTAN